MNRNLWIAVRALTCIAILWGNGIVVSSCSTSYEPFSTLPKIQSSVNESDASTQREANPLAGSPLAGTRWRLVEFRSLDDSSGTVRPDDRSLYTMYLKSNGQVNMRLNCNRATGDWFAAATSDPSNGWFEFEQLKSMRALCPSPSMDKSIAANAQFVRTYLLKDDRLYLALVDDRGVFVWEPDSGVSPVADVPAAPVPKAPIPAAPEDGGPRNWEVTEIAGGLTLREQPSTMARVVSSYASGTILDNLGCQRAERRIWCDVQELGGGARGYVAAEYLKPAVSPDGSVATGPDDSALRAGHGSFDAIGNISCAQPSGQPMEKCIFGVARAGGGYATIVIRRPDGYSRSIFFRMGKAIGVDVHEAEGYPEFRATKEDDLNLIRVGNERYEIPDTVILGG